MAEHKQLRGYNPTAGNLAIIMLWDAFIGEKTVGEVTIGLKVVSAE